MLTALGLFMLQTAQANAVPERPSISQSSPILFDVIARGQDGANQRYLKELIDLEPGYYLKRDDVARSIRRLYSIGIYNNIRVFEHRIKPGLVLLEFRFIAKNTIDKIEIRGVSKNLRRRLLNAIRPQSIDSFGANAETELYRRIRKTLSEAGYSHPRIKLKKRRHVNRKLIYQVDIKTGRPTRIRTIHIHGTPRLRPERIRYLTGIRKRDLADRKNIEQAIKTLANHLRRYGFPSATIVNSTMAINPYKVDLELRIEAHSRIQFEFAGNHYISDSELLKQIRALDIDIQIADLSFSKADYKKKIVDFYANNGRTDVQVKIRQQSDGVDRKLITIIDEGIPTRLKDIQVTNAHALSTTVVRNQLQASMFIPPRPSLTQPIRSKRLQGINIINRSRLHLSKVGHRKPSESIFLPSAIYPAIDSLKSIYRDRGYIDIAIPEPLLTREDKRISIEVQIQEGKQWTLQDVRIAGCRQVSCSELQRILSQSGSTDNTGIAKNRPYIASQVEDGRISLIRRYREDGYLFVKIETSSQIDRSAKQVSLSYQIDEGPRVRIRKRLLTGAYHTLPSLIEDRLTLEEGSIFRTDQASRDQRSLLAMGVFQEASIRMLNPNKPTREKDILVEVTERQRQSIQPYFGLSSADGLRAGLDYFHRNLLGRAMTLSLSAQFNRQLFFFLYGPFESSISERYAGLNVSEQITDGIERNIRAGLRTSWFPEAPIQASGRLDFVHTLSITLPYNLSSFELIAGFDTYPDPLTQVSIEARLKDAFVELCDTDLSSNCAANIGLLNLSEGRRRTFRIGPQVSIDKRNNPLHPRNGLFLESNLSYVQGLSDSSSISSTPFSFFQMDARVYWYKSIGRSTLVLGARLQSLRALSDERIPIEERLLVGGQDDLRGFIQDSLVPADACIVFDNEDLTDTCVFKPSGGPAITTGGNHSASGRVEFRVPITQQSTIVLFNDVGNLWLAWPELDTLTLRVGSGLGWRYSTPVGALSLDLGFNMNPNRRFGETIGPRLHLSIASL